MTNAAKAFSWASLAIAIKHGAFRWCMLCDDVEPHRAEWVNGVAVFECATCWIRRRSTAADSETRPGS